MEKQFTKLEIDDPKKLVFGQAKYPLTYGWGIEIGKGKVIPELKYFPRPERLQNKEDAISIYNKITEETLNHAINLGIDALQLETEFPEKLAINLDWSTEITKSQIEIMEKYHNEHGIKLGFRSTVPDIRNMTKGGLRGGLIQNILDNVQAQSKAGAHLISIESFGGKEVLGHAIIRGDFAGMLFATGILAPLDVRFLWKEIVKNIKNKAIPAGDSACAHANSTMVLAGGLVNRRLSHIYSALVRAISGVRSLAAYESGALGPGKDCGYENIYMKAITGYPMSFEGKTSACAHTSLVGNIAQVCADLWSNESVEHIRLFSGMAPNVFLEMLHYDCELMNAAFTKNKVHELVDLIVESNQFTDPQALILTPTNAIRISKAIISEKGDYHRSIAAAQESLKIMEENVSKLHLPPLELKYLQKMKGEVSKLPDNAATFIAEQSKKYQEKLSEYIPANYGL